MSARIAAVAAALVLALAPGQADAWELPFWDGEVTLDVTDTFIYTYYFDNDPKSYDLSDPQQVIEKRKQLFDDKFHQFFNKLDVSLSYGQFRVGARLDFHIFVDTPYEQLCGGADEPDWCGHETAGSRYNDTFAAERLYAMVTRPEFDLTLGDFYVSFGKGIALHVAQLDEVGMDTTIRGGKMNIHHGQLGFTFVGGVFNGLDLDKTTGMDAPWAGEPVIGARLEYLVADLIMLGAHTVWIMRNDHRDEDEEPMVDAHDGVWGVGVDVPDLLDGMLSFSGELNFRHTVVDGEQIRGPGGEGDGLDGVAAYASATLNVWDITALLEFKYYNEFELIGFEERPYRLMYNLPPTLDRKKAEIKEGNSDVTGARINLDYALGELGPVELVLSANYGYFESWERADYAPPAPGPFVVGPVPVDLSIHSAFGGVELSWGDGAGQLNTTAGVRRLHDNIKDELFHDEVHFEISAEQAFGRHSVEVRYLLLDRATRDPLWKEWNEMELVLTYKWSPYITVSLIYERQEDPAVAAEAQNLFSAIARGYITGSTYINVRVGESRAGIKCLNGICRQMPAFAGVETTLVVRF